MSAEQRIERAILEARKIAATEEAKALARRAGGKHGTWSREDEERLRRGEVVTPGGLLKFGAWRAKSLTT